MARPRGIIQIGGVPLPAPSSFEESVNDIWSEDSGRDINGVFHGQIINKMRTWSAEWKALPLADAQYIMTAILAAQDAGNGSFNLIIIDNDIEGDKNGSSVVRRSTFNVYVSPRTYTYVWWATGKRYVDLSMEFIETGGSTT